MSRPKREVFEKGECERKKQDPAEVDDVNENLSLKNSDDNASNHTGGNLETLFNLQDTESLLSKIFFSPAEEAPAAKSSVLLCSSVADRSSSSSSSGLTVGLLQQSLGGFDRKHRSRSGEEGFPYKGHLGDLLGLSSSEMLTVGCCCAWASPAYQLTLQDLKP